MSSFDSARRLLGYLLAAASSVEIAAVARVLLGGTLELTFGSVHLGLHDPGKPVLIAAVTGCAAAWLLRPRNAGAVSLRFARVCSWIACGAALLGFGLLLEPILRADFLLGHDAGAPQTYAFLMNRALAQGQWPVRWVEGLADGLGQPLFNYYQVGFFYVVELIHRCGPGLSLALKLAVAGAWSGCALFMFLLCRRLGTLPATLAAAVFAGTPYLMVDAYVRTAYTELLGIACVTGVLWAIDGVMRTGRLWFVCLFALLMAALLVSHLPAALITAPLALACAWRGWALRGRPAARLGLLAAGGTIGLGLAAFYVAPALAELGEVRISRLISAYFDYHKHFVTPARWIDWSWGYGGAAADEPNHLSLQIGIVQWGILAASGAVLAAPRSGGSTLLQRRSLALWMLVAMAALFMTTSASTWIWEQIAPLAYVQFPWRFLMLPALACAVLAAQLLSAVRDRAVQALLVVLVVTMQWYVTRDYRIQASNRDRLVITLDDPGWPSSENARRLSFREPGYDPISVTAPPPPVPAAGRWTVAEGQAEISTRHAADDELQLTAVVEQPARLVINTPYFVGWRASIDGRDAPVSVQSGSGYMELHVPAGTHAVDLTLGRTPVRAVADGITLASALVWIGMLAWGMRSPPPTRRPI